LSYDPGLSRRAVNVAKESIFCLNCLGRKYFMEYAQRFKTENMDINCQIKVVSSAKILNMSTDGISMKTNFRLNRDNTYPLKVEDYNNNNLELEATAVWSNVMLRKEGGNLRCDFIPVHSAGMQFSHASKEKPHEIIDYIEKYKQKGGNRVNSLKFSDRRREIRSCINESKRCLLNFSVNCRVQELGMGSMLTKGGHELENGSQVLAMITPPGSDPLKIVGRIISCSFMGGTDTGQVFDTGIEFTEATDEDRERIKRLVRTTIVSDSVKKFRGVTI
jgi:hypothetical protein